MTEKIPEGWKVGTIGEVCHTIYRYPTFYGMETHSHGIPVIRGEHILDSGKLSNDWSAYWYVSKEFHYRYQ